MAQKFMNFNPLEKINNPVIGKQAEKSPTPESLRKVAEQFEAVLLMQLTSALNGSSDENSEDNLFGSDGGSGLAKKMFSEQMATAMAEAGGIGIADMIMKSFGENSPSKMDNKTNPLQKTISAVNDIRNSSSAEPIASPQIFVPEAEQMQNKRERIVADKPITYSQDSLAPNEVSSSNLVSVSSPNSSKAVDFQLPAHGRISSTFGSRFHPIDKKAKFHGGIDVAIPTGTRVNSAADGVVTFAGRKGGYGNLVIVQHPDGRETRYGHLNQILVSVGDSVSGGQEVAKSGSTGKSTGPHLHFEIRENGQVVNPLKILSNVLSKKTDR